MGLKLATKKYLLGSLVPAFPFPLIFVVPCGKEVECELEIWTRFDRLLTRPQGLAFYFFLSLFFCFCQKRERNDRKQEKSKSRGGGRDDSNGWWEELIQPWRGVISREAIRMTVKQSSDYRVSCSSKFMIKLKSSLQTQGIDRTETTGEAVIETLCHSTENVAPKLLGLLSP